MDCFHEGENMLVIDPVECIDCAACVEACPVQAIYFAEDVPGKYSAYIELNAKLAPNWPVLNRKKAAPADADSFKAVSPKRHLVSERAGG